MDVLNAVKGRRSIRGHRNVPVPEALLATLEESLLEAPSAAKKTLHLPDRVRPVAIVPVGYPDERPRAPGRLDGDQVVLRIR